MVLTIFYDDLCPICRTEMMRFYSGYADEMNLIALSTQADVLAQYNIKLEDALTLMHVVDEQGKLHIGMNALRVMYSRFGKPRVAKFTSLPLLRGFFDVAYPVLARHRTLMPVWLLGIGVKDVCQDGYCQMSNGHKAAYIQSKNNEQH